MLTNEGDFRMSDYEAQAFLPYLVQKVYYVTLNGRRVKFRNFTKDGTTYRTRLKNASNLHF